MSVRRDLIFHLTEITCLNFHSHKQKCFEHGDKNGTFLAMLVQYEYPLTIIPEIHTPTGDLLSTQEDILGEFSKFYMTLYSSSLPPDFHRVVNSLIDLYQWVLKPHKSTDK